MFSRNKQNGGSMCRPNANLYLDLRSGKSAYLKCSEFKAPTTDIKHFSTK